MGNGWSGAPTAPERDPDEARPLAAAPVTEAVGPEEPPVERAKLRFVLNGFSDTKGFRVFAFDGIATGQTRVPVTIRADLELSRRYGIRLQELPLLCRTVLERPYEGQPKRAFTYTEEDMCRHAADAAARKEAARQKRPPKQPATERAGSAWRVPTR